MSALLIVLTNKEYLRERAKLFNPTKATAKYHQGRPVSTSDTVYLTAADSGGNAVSCTCTRSGW